MMRVLMVSGDTSFKPGHPRYDLQRSALEELAVVYWGRGSLWPKIPEGKFDVVTAQDPLLRGAFAIRVAKKIGARLNVQVHMDLPALPWWKHVLAQIVLRHADSVRVVSQKIKNQVEKTGTHAPVHVLPIYLDVPKFASVVPRTHASKNILWVGRFEDEKNPLQAIEVLKDVLKTVPDATLTMLGSGSVGQQLSHKAAHLPVTLAGWQDPVLFLDTADVVLCTSWHESWGASMIEALAAGVPVVAPDVGVAREIGADVVERSKLAEKVAEILRSGKKGELKVTLPSRQEWAAQWKNIL